MFLWYYPFWLDRWTSAWSYGQIHKDVKSWTSSSMASCFVLSWSLTWRRPTSSELKSCMAWLRDVERAFRSLILKFCKSLCSKCFLWDTGLLQAAVIVLWSVLSLSRRFLRVFLKPLDFGFSGLADGWGFLGTWKAPLCGLLLLVLLISGSFSSSSLSLLLMKQSWRFICVWRLEIEKSQTDFMWCVYTLGYLGTCPVLGVMCWMSQIIFSLFRIIEVWGTRG